jgi:hypothetical membrane protein
MLADFRKYSIMLPVSVIAGMAAAYTLHPQFPNTFIIWKIQAIDVPLQSFFSTMPLALGREMNSPGPRVMMMNSGILILSVLNFAAVVMFWMKTGYSKLSRDMKSFFLICIPCTIGLFCNQRAIEYACPFIVLFSGIILRDFRKENILFLTKKRGRRIVCEIFILLLVFAPALAFFQNGLRRNEPMNDFGRWLKSSDIAPGTSIANLYWSDFPFLFHCAPHYKYLYGLDPVFAYRFAPEKIRKIKDFISSPPEPEKIHDITGSDYIFLRKNRKSLASKLFKNGYRCVYSGKDGWLFDISAE